MEQERGVPRAQKKNYQKQLDAVIGQLQHARTQEQDAAPTPRKKPSLLLHACCAPCSSYVIEYLAEHFAITILYYNPNIYPPEEYARRLVELERFLPRFAPAVEGGVRLVSAPYNPQEFYDAVGTAESPERAADPEKGERCRRCYEFRLRRAYQYAAENGFQWFTTTLSISPFKDAEKINDIGAALTTIAPGAPRFLPSDFKKNGGFQRSLALSREYGLYRQQYCGCVYSKEGAERGRSAES
ncbi:MAG: epoxyqueuosine reductase QueH [Treponemataceae bacterium]|nr:epoxyqueuosine reductase QueH [Treponemataceae bacterium]